MKDSQQLALLLELMVAGSTPIQFKRFPPQAKNEQDIAAIAALKKSLSLNPNNLEAVLALAASLTNESNQSDACHALKGTMNKPVD